MPCSVCAATGDRMHVRTEKEKPAEREVKKKHLLGEGQPQQSTSQSAPHHPRQETVFDRWLHQGTSTRFVLQTRRIRQVSCRQLQHQCNEQRRLLCEARQQGWLLHHSLSARPRMFQDHASAPNTARMEPAQCPGAPPTHTTRGTS